MSSGSHSILFAPQPGDARLPGGGAAAAAARAKTPQPEISDKPSDRLALYFHLRGEENKLHEFCAEAFKNRASLERHINLIAQVSRRIAVLAQELADSLGDEQEGPR